MSGEAGAARQAAADAEDVFARVRYPGGSNDEIALTRPRRLAPTGFHRSRTPRGATLVNTPAVSRETRAPPSIALDGRQRRAGNVATVYLLATTVPPLRAAGTPPVPWREVIRGCSDPLGGAQAGEDAADAFPCFTWNAWNAWTGGLLRAKGVPSRRAPERGFTWNGRTRSVWRGAARRPRVAATGMVLRGVGVGVGEGGMPTPGRAPAR